jgi:hypothetical protein
MVAHVNLQVVVQVVLLVLDQFLLLVVAVVDQVCPVMATLKLAVVADLVLAEILTKLVVLVVLVVVDKVVQEHH